MTTQEFSDAFDTLLNSYKHSAQFGELSSLMDLTLDEYEKSLFLTQAQDLIVRSYFSRSLNSSGEGFDDSTRKLMDYSNLITVKEIAFNNPIKGSGYSDEGYTLSFKDDDFKVTIDGTQVKCPPLFIINERIKTSDKSYVIIPINYKEYDRIMSKAYCEPLKRQAWRLFESNTSDLTRLVEIILRSDAKTPTKYKVRYVRKPRPIVLVKLTDTSNSLNIDGVNTITECELNPIVHQEILNLAVQMALNTNGIETRDLKAIRELQNNNR